MLKIRTGANYGNGFYRGIRRDLGYCGSCFSPPPSHFVINSAAVQFSSTAPPPELPTVESHKGGMKGREIKIKIPHLIIVETLGK